MRTRITLASVTIVALVAMAAIVVAEEHEGHADDSWSFNATIIEACSCPMFCTCYFGSKPAEHHAGHGESEHFCRFNNAFKVNHGHHGDVKLDGIKFWVAGDLGGDFSEGKMDWAVLTFDKAVTEGQRAAVATILGKLYPVQWDSFSIAEDAKMDWSLDKDRGVAKLDDGKVAEVILHRFKGMTDEPVVIENLTYWGAARNDGFVMMPNEVEAYRVGEKAFEFKGTNGFTITVDMSSDDPA